MLRTYRWATAGLSTIALTFALAAPAMAQTHAGVRAGVSSSPDQFFLGGHVETGKLFDDVSFRPNVELGFGNDLTLVAANVEFVYSIDMKNAPWRVYLGGGPALLIFSGDGPRRSADHSSSVGGGFNLVMGAQHRKGFFGELKIGFVDSPEVKFAVGYAFK